MKSLTFNDEFLASVSNKDFATLVSQLSTDNLFTDKKVHVNRMRIIQDEEYELMVTVEIDLQSWADGQSGMGNCWTWVCNRAKDFSCMCGLGFRESLVSVLANRYNAEKTSGMLGSKSISFWLAVNGGEYLDKTQVLIFIDQVTK